MAIIRSATTGDVPRVLDIEAAADEAFRSVGMADVSDAPVTDAQQLTADISDGRVWVSEVDGEVVAFAVAVLLDDRCHLQQVSVDPRHSGQRLGADLIDVVRDWAHRRGDEQFTLTTFVDVPWNGPYYRRLGFQPVPDDTLGPQLAAALADERRRFAAPRFVMIGTTAPSRSMRP